MRNAVLDQSAMRLIVGAWLSVCAWTASAADGHMDFIDAQIASHAGQSGVYVLDRGEEALLARAWLTDHAQRSIDVQYFIWSSDNIGILAAESLLRAADRGVRVRVIVDDLLIDAPDKSLLALARHPNVDIRIYNPKHSVGTPAHARVVNVVTDFRGVNQRMHNKTLVVDGKLGITGGRNMADEYFDYDQEYNFRDRDVLLLGDAVAHMQMSFDLFWKSELSVNVETLYDGFGLMQKRVGVDDGEVELIYREMHAYAQSPVNFAPEVRTAIDDVPSAFPRLAEQVAWGKVDFISDAPGKNGKRFGLGGGGLATEALSQWVENARERIVIQSPYLVLSRKAMDLFGRAIARGVRVQINTNSLASTDNLQAFSGYRSQRKRLLKMGMEIYEFKPDPAAQRELMRRTAPGTPPIFALHAKTMVIDGKVACIGTFNLDPRSENLNTEAGVVIHDPGVARAVEALIQTDMLPANSWNAATDKPDQYVSFGKRSKVRFWQMMPIKSLL